jgi:ribosomal protein S18 acetylase RimI-like enzyme
MRSSTKEVVFRKILTVPMQLHLSPTFIKLYESRSDQPVCEDIAIYVEPPNAPGLKQLMSKLRRQVLAATPHENIELGHTQLAGNGLRATRKTQSTTSDIRLDEERTPQLAAVGCYRLIVASGLKPIGYCTFRVEISHWQDVEVDIDEVWLARDHRGKGIGQAMADKVADITNFTLQELDARALANSVKSLKLQVLVGGDVYSRSGESFVQWTCGALKGAIDITNWRVIKVNRFTYEARW